VSINLRVTKSCQNYRQIAIFRRLDVSPLHRNNNRISTLVSAYVLTIISATVLRRYGLLLPTEWRGLSVCLSQ